MRGPAARQEDLPPADVGTLALTCQSMQLEGFPGRRLVARYAEPGTPDHDRMVLLDLAATGSRPRPAEEKRD
ncbi:hypothetical protein [Streptomyces geranii]|uniref:hypothetical protein n=1 Tax=Streptomyces geranii TaxID=2058923 RepID=UPI001E60CB8F|nr:hypothetical protein [Streptomyces geranii]